MAQANRRPSESALERAIARAGGVKKLAQALGVSHSSVCGWRASGVIPARQAIAIEVWTQGEIRAVDCLALDR